MNPTYFIFKNSITIHTEGKTIVISEDDKRFKLIYDAIHNNNMDAIKNLPSSEAIEELKTLFLFGDDNETE